MAAITAELVADLQVRITDGTHTWHADEPVTVGGGDTAPDPYAQLLGALAACTCITIAMYARRHDLTVTSLSVEYRHDRVHARDCEDCDDDRTGMIDRITGRVFVDGTFDEAARRRLEEVAVRCPVHKTLATGVVFDEVVFAG